MPPDIELPASVIPVQGYVWIEGNGAISFTGSGFAGFRGRSLRLEGFSIDITPSAGEDVQLLYEGWLQDRGQVPEVQDPEYLGTKGESLRLEAFTMRLVGAQSYIYTVQYMAHEENYGDIGPFADGQICGHTGQSLRLEGIAVAIRVRDMVDASLATRSRRSIAPASASNGASSGATRPKLITPTVASATKDKHAGTATSMTYHGGHLLTNVAVHPIFWGQDWSDAGQAAVAEQLKEFFADILTSSAMDVLGEYNAPGQTISYGTLNGSSTITDTEPGNGTGTVSDAQIQAALQAWVSDGTIPQPASNTLYFVYLPRGVTATMNGGASCTGFCGYHQATGNIYYAVEPWIACGGCNFTGEDPVTNLTKVSFHELMEAITDADTNGWYDENTGNEIGDVCNTASDVTQIDRWYVQTVWSNRANACAV
jgi:Clostridial hydrophobic W